MQSRFVYTAEFEDKIELALSKGRLDAYRALLPNPARFIDIISVYNANTAISEALFGSIQIMEISVRNSIHRQIRKNYGADWHVSNKVNLDNEGNRQVNRLIRHYKDSPRCNTSETLSEKIGSSSRCPRLINI